MFPQSFIHDAVINLTKPEETVLDPILRPGQWTLRRHRLWADTPSESTLTPLHGYLPRPNSSPLRLPEQVTARLSEIAKARRPSDRAEP